MLVAIYVMAATRDFPKSAVSRASWFVYSFINRCISGKIIQFHKESILLKDGILKSFISLAKAQRILKTVESIALFYSFDRPIFIIAPPRSGSTFLFESLSMFKELYYFDWEASNIWWEVFPYDDSQYPCDYIGEEQVSNRSVRTIRNMIYLYSTRYHYRKRCKMVRRLSRFKYLFGLNRIRYFDKTISNCFHLKFLHHVFPDAQYIMLLRDPQENISSMIEGWGRPELCNTQLTPIIRHLRDATIESWSYPAPPGWKDVVSWALPEICAWSWKQHIEYALDFFKNEEKACEIVRYEDLIENNLETVCELAAKLGLVVTGSVIDYLKNPPLSRTTVSAPQRYKWMTKNREAIVSVSPMIKDLAEKIGYTLLSR